MILTIALLLSFQLAGLLLVTLFGLPVPGPVMGMVLFLFALMTVNGLLEKTLPVVNVLLAHFALLFVISTGVEGPASASLNTLIVFRPNGCRLRRLSSDPPSLPWLRPFW